MMKLASVIRPKFDITLDILERELGDKGIANWTKPVGGYFISLYTYNGTAKRTYQLCKEAGVKTVVAKCANEMHQKIMLRVGADQVVFPENESGIRLAKNLLSSGFIDMISLSHDVSMVEIDVKEEWCGKNLIELNLRKKYGFNIVAIKKGEKVTVNINPEQVLDAETTLIVIANTAKLSKLK